ncbi:MAG: phosphoenolpyruvate--protein phosphotransferase, partial [Acidobacteriota bacterium]
MKKLKGKPVSQGIVIGKATILKSHTDIAIKEKLEKSSVPAELKRFNNALRSTRLQLKKIYKNLQQVMGKDSSLIIESQSMLLNDTRLINEIKDKIRTNRVNSEWAIKEVAKKYLDFFNNIKDLSFREKGNDIADILGRISENLSKSSKSDDQKIGNMVLVADDLTPSTAAGLMSKGKILGIILNNGGETSHTVILARTLGIPTILDTGNATDEIANEDTLIVDGLSGEIIVNPKEQYLAKTRIKIEKFNAHKERLKKIIKLPDVTKDKKEFKLMANIELAFESDLVNSYGASGIGLFRTEFMFMDPGIALSEEEQYLIYKNIAQKVYPAEVTIRTFDVGRDKGARYFKTGKERNPALGTMAVRLFLKEEKIFRTQIKSIMRANENGNIKILFPMITEVEEINTIKRIMTEAADELRSEKKLPEHKLETGIMIEIPGTIKLIKHLKDEIDFYSIGSNDLIQYLLAVERDNSSLSYLFNPYQPSVIESLI